MRNAKDLTQIKSAWSTGFRSVFGPRLCGLIRTTLQLESWKRIPDHTQCINFAPNGNIYGFKCLFKHSLASPQDISTSCGYSIFRWALYGKQYETGGFLVHSGADPRYKPVAVSDNCPCIKAYRFLLESDLSDTAVKAMRTITRGSDYLEDLIDDSKFTTTHMTVLGLSTRNLEEELLLHQEHVNVLDAMGRTALAWTATRGDRRSVATLLSYGADPNITDAQLSGPLSKVAAQGHTVCVVFVLETGADRNRLFLRVSRKEELLNVAARNINDPLLLERFLDFGADVDQCSTQMAKQRCSTLLHAAPRCKERQRKFSHSVIFTFGAFSAYHDPPNGERD